MKIDESHKHISPKAMVYDPGPHPAPILEGLARLVTKYIYEPERDPVAALALAEAHRLAIKADARQIVVYADRTPEEIEAINRLCDLLSKIPPEGFIRFGQIGNSQFYGFIQSEEETL